MRSLLFAAMVLLALLPSPATGQDSPPLLEDASGDARLGVQGTDAADAGPLYPAVDLVSLQIEETATELAWILTVSDLRDGDEETGADGSRYDIEFEHNGRYFQLAVSNVIPATSQPMTLFLFARDTPTGEWNFLSFQPGIPTVDYAADTIRAPLPRNLLADAQGAVPFPGRWLEGINVHAQSALSGGTISTGDTSTPIPATVDDRMPNAGVAPARYAISIGLAQTGNARLFSEQPYRASNGEATTFLYEVQATNIGPAEDTFTLEAVSVPTKLAVVLPVPVLVLGPGESRQVPVLVSVPFAHQHGVVEDFIIEMRSGSDPGSVGRQQMGINYLEIAQPAGHHDTVYLHVGAGQALGPISTQEGFMNTVQEDDNDLGVNYYFSNGISCCGSFATWQYSLGPALQMGLDVDLNGTGELRFTIGSATPLVDARVEASVFVGSGFRGFEGRTHVASMPQTDPVNILPNAPVVIEGPIVGVDEGDRIPFVAGQNLWLEIRVTYTGSPVVTAIDEESPYIAPGGYARLPLLEYHDAVDDVLASLGGPGLSPLGAQERLVNPGKAVVFPVSIANAADESVTYELVVSGPNVAWASLPAVKLQVAAHGTATATVIVRAPADAQDGERADLVLQAFSPQDPTVRGLLRLVAEVDTDAEHPDDSAQATNLEKKQSPSLMVGALLVVLIGLSWRRRRHRS